MGEHYGTGVENRMRAQAQIAKLILGRKVSFQSLICLFVSNEACSSFFAVGFIVLHQLLNCLPQASDTYLSDKE